MGVRRSTDDLLLRLTRTMRWRPALASILEMTSVNQVLETSRHPWIKMRPISGDVTLGTHLQAKAARVSRKLGRGTAHSRQEGASPCQVQRLGSTQTPQPPHILLLLRCTTKHNT